MNNEKLDENGLHKSTSRLENTLPLGLFADVDDDGDNILEPYYPSLTYTHTQSIDQLISHNCEHIFGFED